MRYFIDTEFMESGPNEAVILLSIGITCEDGRMYYAVNGHADLSVANSFVRENVTPYLGGNFKTPEEIKEDLITFIWDLPEFWGYFADYDWVVFCQIFGTMMDLPTNWPMYCNDLKQEHVRLGRPKLPEQISAKHNALSDAIWNEKIYNYLKAL